MASLNVKRAAEVLEVHPHTVRRWADQGLLRAYRLPGGARRFDAGELLAFRQQLRQGASS